MCVANVFERAVELAGFAHVEDLDSLGMLFEAVWIDLPDAGKGVLISLGELTERAGELARDRPVVAMCRAGSRSAQATVILHEAGFGDVANLTGGMLR